MTLPKSVDWRYRWGNTWLTRARDQGPIGDCFIYAAVGVFEAMLRIEHGIWAPRSESDVGDSISFRFGAKSKAGGGPAEVFDWIKQNGVADPGSWPSLDTFRVASPTPDRLGRTSYLISSDQLDDNLAAPASSTVIGNADDMKTWLHLNGPITGEFECYKDFHSACKNGAVYIRDTTASDTPTAHCIMIVGYDDDLLVDKKKDRRGAWLIRNSWGAGWGTEGYGWFPYYSDGYGFESKASYGVLGSTVSVDPWSRRRLSNGSLLVTGNGPRHNNLEVWAPGPNSSVQRYVQNGETLAWTADAELPEVHLPFAGSPQGRDCAAPPSVISSTYFRNYEVVYQTTSGALRHVFLDQLTQSWTSHGVFAAGQVAGAIGLVQVNVGAPGNFELVVKTPTGELENWWRDNSRNKGAWVLKQSFGAGVRQSGRSLVQRWMSPPAGEDPPPAKYWQLPAGLDVVCVNESQRMQRWWRDDPNTDQWVACEEFGEGVSSAPVMIRSLYGAGDETVPGNYELCVAVDGEVQHWWTYGDPEPHGQANWTMSTTFTTNRKNTSVKQVLGLTQLNAALDLEVIVELSDGGLQHFSRRSGVWVAGDVFGVLG